MPLFSYGIVKPGQCHTAYIGTQVPLILPCTTPQQAVQVCVCGGGDKFVDSKLASEAENVSRPSPLVMWTSKVPMDCMTENFC